MFPVHTVLVNGYNDNGYFLYLACVLCLLAIIFVPLLATEIPNPAQEAQRTYKE